MDDQEHITVVNPLDLANAKLRSNKMMGKLKHYMMKNGTLEKKIGGLTKKIKDLSNEKNSLEVKYCELLEKYELLVKEHSELERTYEESLQISWDTIPNFSYKQDFFKGLTPINVPLNQPYQNQANKVDKFSSKAFKELKDENSKLKNKLENSVLLGKRRKQLKYCCRDTHKDWIDSITKAIIKTNIDEVPPSNVLFKLSNNILKLANEIMIQEKFEKEEEIKFKGKEEANALEKKEKKSLPIERVPQTLNVRSQEYPMSFSNPIKENYGDNKSSSPLVEKYQVIGRSFQLQKRNNNDVIPIIYADGASYMCL